MPIKQVIQEGGQPVKVWTDEFEAKARQQLVNLASLPFIHHHVAAMPDVHTGIGATIGSVIACSVGRYRGSARRCPSNTS